jgi:hypothetical protein
MTRYPSGRYIVRYEGTPPTYKFDAVKIESSPGRDVLEVTPSGAGIYLETTGPLTKLSVVQEQYETLHNAGELFHPLFLEKLKALNLRGIRFEGWMMTDNGSTQGSWRKRPKVTDAFWGTKKGVPLEVIIELCNRLGISPWFNMPHGCNLTYVREFCKLVKSHLLPCLDIYVELSNEVWNGSSAYEPQRQYMIAQGKKLWPTSDKPDWRLGFEFYASKISQIGTLCKSILGDRVKVVLSGQAANVGVAQAMLDFPRVFDSIDCLAIAPYFGDTFTGTMDDFFNLQVPQDIQKAMDCVKAHKTLADQYGLGLVAYEGGQGYGFNVSDPNFYIQANRDPRMGIALLDYLNQWEALGGGLFCHLGFISADGKYGCWGVLQSPMQTTSPKYEALRAYEGVLGINLSGVSYWTMTFLDATKNNDAWVPQSPKGWGTGQPVDADSQGWINSVPPGQTVGMLMYRSLPSV